MPAVLIFGGSRGARPINEAVVKALAELGEKPYQVLYITGDVHFEDVKKEVDLIGNPKNVVIKPFIHNMPEVLAGIDLSCFKGWGNNACGINITWNSKYFNSKSVCNK